MDESQRLHEEINAFAAEMWEQYQDERPSIVAGLTTTTGKAKKPPKPVVLPPDTPPLPKKKYRVLLSDLPWQYKNFAKGDETAKKWGGASFHYPTVSIEQMKLFPFADITDEESAAHYMWTTTTHIKDSFSLLESFGCTFYNVAFTWEKTYANGEPICGMGFNTRQSNEFVVLGFRGKMPERLDASVNSTVRAPAGKHSEKPAEVRDRIVRLHGDIPRIELFAREAAAGWDVWGNQAPNP